MSFADTYSAATASIVVSPWTTDTSCIGPQLEGVIAPENVPLATALAEPANTVIKKAAAARAAMTRPGRKLTELLPDWAPHTPCARKSGGNIP
jgi:hypothetical protein